ncbi:alpha/beta fold hydrolase [Nocardia sp. NPDC058058]|uniref:alpha/beta fold hydrolase n=1 Tax=Nocardia sp. NPDC058058 TaxID=3346317 RepID=UPI0036DC2130
MAKIGRFVSEQARTEFRTTYDALAARWPVPAVDLEVETSYGTTHVRKSGDGNGAPLLLFPGIGGSSLFWQPFIAELSRGRVVYAPDIIGWAGRCEQTAPVRDEADIARWAAEVLDGLGVRQAHVVGYSLGGWLAAVVAGYRPERVATLSLLETAPATFARPPWRVLRKFMAAGVRPSRAKLEKFNTWLQPGVELDELEWAMVLGTLKFRPGLPWPKPLSDERFAAVSAPVLALFGAETVVHDPEVAAARVRRVLPGADVEICPGAGHDLLWVLPEQVIGRVLEFAGRYDRVDQE